LSNHVHGMHAHNYMRSVPVFLFLAQATWTSTLGTRFDVVVACWSKWRSGAIAAAIDCAILCHFLIIHGGSFGYKMFSILRARQHAWTTTSFCAHRIPALVPITILFHCAYNSAQTMTYASLSWSETMNCWKV
jgi:hypothetical protein